MLRVRVTPSVRESQPHEVRTYELVAMDARTAPATEVARTNGGEQLANTACAPLASSVLHLPLRPHHAAEADVARGCRSHRRHTRRGTIPVRVIDVAQMRAAL